ncbi:MAG: hypothetical protein KIS87_15235 [Phycisphaeraceae bacterium]|nr:hypothetical protein [Phycisphaeraceae bacterium]
MARKIRLRIKARHEDDPARIFGAIEQTWSGCDLDLHYEEKDDLRRRSEPAAAPTPIAGTGTTKPPTPVPDEPGETEFAAAANKSLDDRRDQMRARGEDPDVRKQAGAGERLEKRRRLKDFGKWLRDRFGAASITVTVSKFVDWVTGLF